MFPPPAVADSFFVEGSAKMRLYAPDGSSNDQATMLFTLSVENCRWLLRFKRDYQGADGTHAPDYQEVSCDETNVYFLSNIKSEVERLKASHTNVGPNVANGLTYPGQVFHHRLADEVGAIWLAYAATCYFQSQTSSFIEPAMAFDGFGGTYEPAGHEKLRAEWTLTSSKPNLPAQVVYFGDGYKTIRGRRAKLAPPYDRGFTNAIYQVATFTNVSGLTLPLDASLKVFTSRPGAAVAEDLRVLVEYRVHLTSAGKSVDAVTFQPALPGVTLLDDRRVGPLQYFATNQWPQVAMLDTGAYFMQLRAINANPPPARRPLSLRIFMIVTLLLPIVAYMVWRRKTGVKNA